MNYLPNIIETVGRTKKIFSIPDKLYNESNIITLFGEINEDISYSVVSQLLYLDSKESNENVKLYINSPGGSVYEGLAIYDTMRNMNRKVDAICVGSAMSMGQFLLTGATGERKALPNARIMAHSVSSGVGGTIHDMKIDLKETEYLQNKLMRIISENSKGKLSIEELEKMTLRDKFLSPEECIELGLIDSVV